MDGIRLIVRVREEQDAVLLGYSRPGFEATHLADGQARKGEKVRKPVALVVEDDPLLRLDAIDMVEEAGFLTFGAANADPVPRMSLRYPHYRQRHRHAAGPGWNSACKDGPSPLAAYRDHSRIRQSRIRGLDPGSGLIL
jgi:hypothetical protein